MESFLQNSFLIEGIIAGTGRATYEAKMYVLPAANEWMSQTNADRLPDASMATLTVHIDDLTLNVASLGFHQCVATMKDRAFSLAQLIRDLLRVPLAEKKLCFTGTSKPIMDACQLALGK